VPRPSFTGSEPIMNTVRMTLVAAFAGSAEWLMNCTTHLVQAANGRTVGDAVEALNFFSNLTSLTSPGFILIA